MSTALVVGGSAATGRAIIEELKNRGYEITVFNRGTRNDGLSRDLEFVRGDPHFAGSVRDARAEDQLAEEAEHRPFFRHALEGASQVLGVKLGENVVRGP